MKDLRFMARRLRPQVARCKPQRQSAGQGAGETENVPEVNLYPEPIDLKKIKVFPLSQRESLSAIDKILARPEQAPARCSPEIEKAIEDCAAKIRSARE